MAVNEVQQLVNRRNAIEKELKNKEKLLASLREAHYTFWTTLRSQCSQTFHDQTPEQVKERRARSVMREERQKIPFQRRLAHSSPFTFDDLKMMQGYCCPYCRGRVGGYQNDHDSRFDIDSRSDFASWLVQDTSNWPQEKISIYQSAKKEVEEYFDEVEPLEKLVADLRRELQDIYKEIDTIWHMCDSVLGKSEEYESTIAKLNWELTPYDRDRYYND